MITEDYVSFETAKLLKEKGFPQDPNICNTAYTFKGKFSNNAKSFAHNFTEFNKCGIKPMSYSMAPTQQMAMCWLREVHNIAIVVTPSMFWGKYNAHIYEKGNEYPMGFDGNSLCPSYEEACEVAIKYCLEKLI